MTLELDREAHLARRIRTRYIASSPLYSPCWRRKTDASNQIDSLCRKMKCLIPLLKLRRTKHTYSLLKVNERDSSWIKEARLLSWTSSHHLGFYVFTPA